LQDVCTTGERLFKELDEYIKSINATPDKLISVLQKAQEIFGYLSPQVQQYIADALNIPVSQVYGVVTFYNFFSTTPKGKVQIKVCLGTACYVKGADRVFERFLEELGVEPEKPTKDGQFSVHAVRCLGACSMAPVVLVGEKDFYGRLKPDMVSRIIAKYREVKS